MVDQNNFINSYIDVIINSLIEYVKANLQLQTQIKVANDAIQQKDSIIAALNEQITQNIVAEDWKSKYEKSEQNYLAAMSKLSHMDNLLKQVGDMKKLILEKDDKINKLAGELKDIKNPNQKVINTKIKKKAEEPVTKQASQEKNDF